MIQSKIPWVNDAGTDLLETNEHWQSFTTEIRPVKGWKINADYSFRNTDFLRRDREITVFDNLVDRTQVPSGNTVPSNYEVTHDSDEYWTANIYTTVDFTLGANHNFTVLAGAQYEQSKNRSLNSFRTNFLVPSILSLNTADGEIQSMRLY